MINMIDGFWKNKSVFITGCTGLLGSWLTKELVLQSANVVGLIRDITPYSNLYLMGTHNCINIVKGDIKDLYTIERTLNEYEVDTIFHLAAQTIVGTANRNPLSTFEANIKGTWNVLEAARRVPGIKRIIVASSDKAYGNQKRLPYDETTPLQGQHPYDVSKSCADMITKSYHKTFDLPVCVTRCGNFYGGGDLNFNRIVPGTIKSALSNERPVIRSDGKYIRDYFYIKDGVLAYLHLARKMSEIDVTGEAFNFSNEIQINALELTNLILKLLGKEDLTPIILNQAQNEIKHQYLSANKAKNVLDWQAKYTLEQGLTETIEWYKEFLNVQDSGKKHLRDYDKAFKANY